MSNLASPRVLPPLATASAISSSRAPWIALASDAEQGAALRERQRAELASRRPCARSANAAARSWPPPATSASGSSVAGLTSVRRGPEPGGPGCPRGSWRGAAWPRFIANHAVIVAAAVAVADVVKRLLYGLRRPDDRRVSAAALGYWVIGDGRWPFGDCLYMTVITVTTVGYGEVLPGMDEVEYARGFTMLLLVFGTGSIVFFASTITAFIIEGDLKNVLFANRLKKRMKRMKDHVVVCGAGLDGPQRDRGAAEDRRAGDRDRHATRAELKEIADAASRRPSSAYIVGDATDDDVMAQTNLARRARARRGAVVGQGQPLPDGVGAPAQPERADRRALRRAVARREDPASRAPTRSCRRTTSAACAWSPRCCAPRSCGSSTTCCVTRRAAYRIEEVTLGDRRAALGGTLRDARVRERFGMTVLAMRRKRRPRSWTYNPDAEREARPRA